MRYFLFLVVFLSNTIQAQNTSFFYLVDIDSFKIDDYDKQLIDSILTLYHNTSDEIEQLSYLNDLIDNCYNNIWIDYNKIMYQSALDIIKTSKDTSIVSNATYYYGASFGNKAYLFDTQNNIDSAEKYYLKALDEFKKINNKSGIVHIYNQLAPIYDTEGNVQKAIDYHQKAIDVCLEINDDRGLAYAYMSLGSLNEDLKNIKIIKTYYKNAYHYALKSDDKLIEGFSLFNLARLNYYDGDFTEAKKNIYKGLNIFKENNIDEYSKINGYVTIGNIFEKEQNYDSAFYYYNLILTIANQENANEYKAVSLSKLARLNLILNNVDTALNQALKALDIVQNFNLVDRETNILKNLAAIYEAKGEYKKANKYLNDYIVLQAEEVNDENKQAAIRQNFQIEYEKQKVADAIEHEKELAIKEKDKQLNRIIAFAAATIAIIIFIALFLLYNRYRLINQQKKSLNIAYEQLEESKNNEILVSNLKALQSQMNPHFIFNALNSIQTLVLKGDVNNSYTYINKFADLIRKTLNFSELKWVNIEDEIQLLETYLNLEKLRFRDDFNYNIEIDKIPNIKVPPMLIQPFVENALKHGLLHKETNRVVSLKLHFDEVLICEVEDNGIGRKASALINERRDKSHKSFAISAITKRFNLLQENFDYNIGFEYVDLYEKEQAIGTKVIIRIPYKKVRS